VARWRAGAGLPTEGAGLELGHSLELLDPDAKVTEIKMGPFPGNDAADKVDLDVDHEPVPSST
jgi:hypothetical protein